MDHWSEAEALAESAHTLLEQGRWEEAASALTRALEVNPEQGDWYFGLGVALDALQRFDQAIEAFGQAARYREENTEALLNLGIDLIRCERFEEAAQRLQELIALDPEHVEALAYLILAYTELHAFEEAELAFYLAVQIEEDHPVVYDHLGRCMLEKGNLQQAALAYERVLGIDPNYPDAYLQLARVFWLDEQYEMAHHWMVRQTRACPGDTQTLMEFGALLIEMDRLDEAREKFNRVKELDPDCAAAYHHLAELAMRQGHDVAARADLNRASHLDPQRPGVDLMLARLELQRDDFASARQLLESELKRNGHSIGQLLELARLLLETQMPNHTLDVLYPLLSGHCGVRVQEAGDLSLAYTYRGVALMLLGYREDGMRDCRDALHMDPDNLLALHNLIVGYTADDELKRARVFLRRALKVYPDDQLLQRLQRRVQHRSRTRTFRWLAKRVTHLWEAVRPPAPRRRLYA